jgi:hypothetical protein
MFFVQKEMATPAKKGAASWRNGGEGGRFFSKETGQTGRVIELSFHVDSVKEIRFGVRA